MYPSRTHRVVHSMPSGRPPGNGPFVVNIVRPGHRGDVPAVAAGAAPDPIGPSGPPARGSLPRMTDRAPGRRSDPWAWVALASAIGFAILALIVNEQGAVAFDEPVIGFVKGLPVPTDVWIAITEAGGAILVPISIGIVVTLLLLHRPRTALIYGVALAAASAWTHLVKVTIGRLRPPGEALVAPPGSASPRATASTARSPTD